MSRVSAVVLRRPFRIGEGKKGVEVEDEDEDDRRHAFEAFAMSDWFTPWLAAAFLFAVSFAAEDPSVWTIYVANDNCPDYTWGLTEAQTRKAFADIVRGHLDEMNRTDDEPPECQDRYNMAVTQEALCFVEHYPERKDELVRRIKQGRAYVSPYLCNSLWAFQGVEAALRTFYPARRLERDWGIPRIDVAEHIEEPSLPWGLATLLPGCGIRWLSNPFYAYDSTFGGLKNPPLFVLEGPDGSQLRVAMDPFASNGASYTQGAKLLREPQAIPTWTAHYAKLGDAYKTRAILASGTHGDINPGSGGQARGFAEKIIAWNQRPGPHPKLVNAALPQFCKAVDDDQAKTPFLPTLRGSFGHSWDVWPVCLAKTVADLREAERRFLAAETLLALAVSRDGDLRAATRADRERAEWCLAMLGDHAWNGTDDRNKHHNADLRRAWAQELLALSHKLTDQARGCLQRDDDERFVTLFNPMCYPRTDLVRIEAPPDLKVEGAQSVEEDGRRVLYFVSPRLESLSFHLPLPEASVPEPPDRLRAAPLELESPFYRLTVDPKTGGIASLVHKPTGAELVVKGNRTLCQSVYFDGQEHVLADAKPEVVASGPVLARLRITATTAGIQLATSVTLYAELDRVDFDLRIHKPVTTRQERLCHVFPILREGAVLRVETTGAVIRPRPQPEGDLLPGADTRRFAVQGFVDASVPDGVGVTIAPLDAFLLRADLDPVTFEALGNDQNYREVLQDQGGATDFRFRYSLRAHSGGYNGAEAFAWSRSVATPIQVFRGRTPEGVGGRIHRCDVDPARAIVTCLKPADDPAAGGVILRLWETAGRSGPITIGVEGFDAAWRTDLLERDVEDLKVGDGTLTRGGKLTIDLRAHGFATVRLLP